MYDPRIAAPGRSRTEKDHKTSCTYPQKMCVCRHFPTEQEEPRYYCSWAEYQAEGRRQDALDAAEDRG